MMDLLKNNLESSDFGKLNKYMNSKEGKFILINPVLESFRFPFIIYIPITSNYIHPEENKMHEFFPMQATRNVVFCKNKKHIYYNIFKQINNQIKYIRNLLRATYNIVLDKKIICHGFSSSAKFVLRYATLFSENVSLLIAGGFGSQAILPLKSLNNINLLYPVGVYDVPFDLESFKRMKQFYFMGNLENENNDTAMNFKHTDEVIKNLYIQIFGKGIWKRYEKIKEVYSNLKIENAEFIKYDDYGHTYNPIAREYTKSLIVKYRV